MLCLEIHFSSLTITKDDSSVKAYDSKGCFADGTVSKLRTSFVPPFEAFGHVVTLNGQQRCRWFPLLRADGATDEWKASESRLAQNEFRETGFDVFELSSAKRKFDQMSSNFKYERLSEAQSSVVTKVSSAVER